MSTTAPTAVTTLEDAIQHAGGPLQMLRSSAGIPLTGPTVGQELSNWRDEQASWQQTCALFDLSHHMTDLTVRGPDAIRFLSELGVNSLANFVIGKAKQTVAVTEEGFIIGDTITEYIGPEEVRLVGMINVANWAQFLIETGDYNVTYVREDPTAINPVGHPELYRYQLQGPTAIDIFTKVNGGVRPELAFFTAGEFRVGDYHVRGLGHGMTRSGGMEITGPWAESAAVRELLLEAGEEFGLVPNGSRAPTPGALESGWFGTPLPAVYTGESTRAFRKWLPADGFEATGSLGGSYISDDMTDYYLTPQDLGYGRLVKFDHDFIGRDALERGLAGPKRRKVTLAWNSKDVLGVIATAFEQGDPAKWMEFPFSTYSTWPYDAVHSGDRTVGFSAFSGYTYNERKVLSLAVVEDEVEEGSEVTVVWGEPDGGSSRPIVERHVQTEIRATVSRVPFSNIDEK